MLLTRNGGIRMPEAEKLYVNYIETTLSGEINKRITICEFEAGKDYLGELKFNLDGEEVEYYEKFSGDYSWTDKFFEDQSTEDLTDYQDDNDINVPVNVMLEFWKTDQLGWYDDRYVGLELSTVKGDERGKL